MIYTMDKGRKTCLLRLTLWIDHQWPSPWSVDDDGIPQQLQIYIHISHFLMISPLPWNIMDKFPAWLGAQLDRERIVGKRVNHPPATLSMSKRVNICECTSMLWSNLYWIYTNLASSYFPIDFVLPMFAVWMGFIRLPGADNCRRTAGSSRVLQAHSACCIPAEQRRTEFNRACLQYLKECLNQS